MAWRFSGNVLGIMRQTRQLRHTAMNIGPISVSLLRRRVRIVCRCGMQVTLEVAGEDNACGKAEIGVLCPACRAKIAMPVRAGEVAVGTASCSSVS